MYTTTEACIYGQKRNERHLFWPILSRCTSHYWPITQSEVVFKTKRWWQNLSCNWKNKHCVAGSAGASLVLVNMHPERGCFQRNERHDRWSSESIDDLVNRSIDKDLSRIDFSWLILRSSFWFNLYFRWIADLNWHIGLGERMLLIIEGSSLTDWQQEQKYFMRSSCVSGNRVAWSGNEHTSLSLVFRRGDERSRVK